MKKIVLCHWMLLVLLLNIGCNKTEKAVVKFRYETDVNLDSIKIPPVLLDEKKFLLSNDYLISMCMNPDTIFRVFKYPELTYLGGFGTIGRGPEEFLSPIISSTNFYDNHISVTDLKSVKLLEIQASNQRLRFVNNKVTIPLPGNLSPLNYAYLINDSIIYGLLLSNKEKELTAYNVKSHKISNVIEFPNLFPELPKSSYNTLFLKQIAFAPNRLKFVFTYLQIPVIRIFSINGNLLKQINYSQAPNQTDFTVVDGRLVNKYRYFYYQNVEVTNDYIYSFYELRQLTEKGINSQSQKEIHIFDWDGNAILKIKLKNWISFFGISPDNKKLYFSNPFKEDYLYFMSLDLK